MPGPRGRLRGAVLPHSSPRAPSCH